MANSLNKMISSIYVATALTVYGIETFYQRPLVGIYRYHVATALTVYGIET